MLWNIINKISLEIVKWMYYQSKVQRAIFPLICCHGLVDLSLFVMFYFPLPAFVSFPPFFCVDLFAIN